MKVVSEIHRFFLLFSIPSTSSAVYSDNHSQDDSVIHELANISPPIAINDPEILLSEAEWAIAKLRNNKGVGIDGIPAELIKNGGEDLTKKIFEICKWIWDNEELPQIWAQSILVTIPKKDILDCSNYRTISLISHSSQNIATHYSKSFAGSTGNVSV